MEAGKRYYVEVRLQGGRHKKDRYMNLRWQGPGGWIENPIPGHRFIPATTREPKITVTAPASRLVSLAGPVDSAGFHVAATATGDAQIVSMAIEVDGVIVQEFERDFISDMIPLQSIGRCKVRILATDSEGMTGSTKYFTVNNTGV